MQEGAPTRQECDDYCCEEFRSAVEVTFAAPVNGPTGWLLYGTDRDSVSAGTPELRYWAARYCPFCGAALRPYPGELPHGRVFGFDRTAPASVTAGTSTEVTRPLPERRKPDDIT
jgi:hypothetical protein